MKARVTWLHDHTYVGEMESGHSVVIGTPTAGSPKPGPSAMELVLMGAGSCSSWDVIEILKKSRQDIEDVICDLDATRRDEAPKIFTRIHLQFTVKGRGLDERRVARAVDLAVEKYCSVLEMLKSTAEITHGFEIVEVA